MGTEAAALYIKVDADVDKAVASLAHVDKTVDQIAGNVERHSGKLSQILTGIGQGIGQQIPMMAERGLGMVVGFMEGAVNAASNMNETVSKVGVVFGAASKDVLAFGEDAASSMGMAKEQALAGAATFGNLFVSMGMAEGKSAEMSTSLVQLASDLASFNNIDPTVALEKLRAGLTGEAEPLKTLGVNMNEVTLKAKAMEMGLSDGKTVLDASSKAQAAYALILEQTKTAQGDFARTSDGLANSQRIMNAEIGDAMAKLGQTLLPIVTAAVKELVPAIVGLTDVVLASAKELGLFVGNLQTLAGIAGDILNPTDAWTSALHRTREAMVEAGVFAREEFTPVLLGLGISAQDVATVFDATGRVIGSSWPEYLEKAGGEGATRFSEAIAKTTSAAAEAVVKWTTDVLEPGVLAVIDTMAGLPQKAIDAFAQAKIDIGTAKETFQKIVDDAMTPAQVRAGFKGDLTSKEYHKAVLKAAKDPSAAADLEEAVFGLIDGALASGMTLKNITKWAAAHGDTYLQGAVDKYNSEGLRGGITGAVKGAVTAGAGDPSIITLMHGYGWSTGSAWGRGVASGVRGSKELIDGSIAYIGTLVRAKSPPGPESPLHEIDIWGERTGEAWAEGLARGISRAKSLISDALWTPWSVSPFTGEGGWTPSGGDQRDERIRRTMMGLPAIPGIPGGPAEGGLPGGTPPPGTPYGWSEITPGAWGAGQPTPGWSNVLGIGWQKEIAGPTPGSGGTTVGGGTIWDARAWEQQQAAIHGLEVYNQVILDVNKAEIDRVAAIKASTLAAEDEARHRTMQAAEEEYRGTFGGFGRPLNAPFGAQVAYDQAVKAFEAAEAAAKELTTAAITQEEAAAALDEAAAKFAANPFAKGAQEAYEAAQAVYAAQQAAGFAPPPPTPPGQQESAARVAWRAGFSASLPQGYNIADLPALEAAYAAAHGPMPMFAGGYVPPGQWAITGERGPEPIYGGRTGATVLPNEALGGRGDIHLHFDVQGPAIFDPAGEGASQLARQMLPAIIRELRAGGVTI